MIMAETRKQNEIIEYFHHYPISSYQNQELY